MPAAREGDSLYLPAQAARKSNSADGTRGYPHNAAPQAQAQVPDPEDERVVAMKLAMMEIKANEASRRPSMARSMPGTPALPMANLLPAGPRGVASPRSMAAGGAVVPAIKLDSLAMPLAKNVDSFTNLDSFATSVGGRMHRSGSPSMNAPQSSPRTRELSPHSLLIRSASLRKELGGVLGSPRSGSPPARPSSPPLQRDVSSVSLAPLGSPRSGSPVPTPQVPRLDGLGLSWSVDVLRALEGVRSSSPMPPAPELQGLRFNSPSRGTAPATMMSASHSVSILPSCPTGLPPASGEQQLEGLSTTGSTGSWAQHMNTSSLSQAQMRSDVQLGQWFVPSEAPVRSASKDGTRRPGSKEAMMPMRSGSKEAHPMRSGSKEALLPLRSGSSASLLPLRIGCASLLPLRIGIIASLLPGRRVPSLLAERTGASEGTNHCPNCTSLRI
eukprot:gnl/TRDRNA2_/TRDRNA2_62335_c0_seq1.p1 gnl/TRDRNA2_/TRDRNA2_62335_c0~~gnl/TRDRNA2_/TRDRNA2_62335_c0_seq1.p1  ORF type:complete len:462 (+),score=46.01 gnl/TRDRNA2_/TRDRNA2_62335_c0_seq1:58-1386(+)